MLDQAVLPSKHKGDSQISDSQSIRSSEHNSHDELKQNADKKSDNRSCGSNSMMSNGSGSILKKKRA